VDDGQRLAAVALVIRRELPLARSWLYVPHGPIASMDSQPWKRIQEKLTEIAAAENAVFVRVDPPWSEATAGKSLVAALTAQRWRKSQREVQPRHTLLLDVQSSQEELLAHMHAKARYNIRLAARKGVTVRFSSAVEDIGIFLALTRHVKGRSGFHFHPDDYYRAIMKVLGPARMAELAIAEHEGDALAVHLMIYAGPVATYAHGASSQEKKQFMAPASLYWETIKRAKQLGCTSYDFFGVAPLDVPSDHPWAGITRIKQSFGGQRISYIGAYDLVLNESFYTVFNALRRVRHLLR
ncbi:MAG: lipid II:glycine glycyltransferase FemX, partial [Candidatus Binatia bacterium]